MPTIYSGSLVVRGSGIAEVHATGAHAEIGRIGKALASIDPATPRLAQQTRRLVRVFATVGLGASLIAAGIYGVTQGSWLKGGLAGIARNTSRSAMTSSLVRPSRMRRPGGRAIHWL